MEALGAAASVAGLVSLALEVPKIIDTIITIKSAPEEAKQLLETVSVLVATLQRLEAFLKSDKAEDLELKDDSILPVLISICKDRVLSLLKKLRSHLPKTSSTRFPSLKTVKETATKLRWPFDKTECLNLVAEISAMQNAFEFCLAMQNYQQMVKSHREIIGYFKKQGDSLDKIKAFFPDLAGHISTMLEKTKVFEAYLQDADQKLSNIQAAAEELQMANKDFIEQDADNLYGQALEWLSPIDPSEEHGKISEARLPKTCEWILTNAHFERWLKTPPSDDYAGVSCWVGDPGQGKTFTMSLIIDHLADSRLSDDTIYLSYLYCDYESTEGYSETSLAGAIVRQLLTQFEQLPKKVAELVRDAHIKHKRSNAKMDEVIMVLTHLSTTVKRLLVCVDALDECKKADSLVAACAKFPLPTSFIFIGRRSIVKTVKQSFPSAIDRPMELQTKDVDAIVLDKIKADKRRQPNLMPASLEKAIRSEVGKLANGIHDTVHQRREALKDLSSTLKSAFDRSIARIREGSHSSRAFRILAWIHLARPLRLDELAHALAIECHHTRFYQDNLPSPIAILDCCLGLVKLDNPKGLQDISDQSTTVTLVHSTLRVYLDSNLEILREVAPTLAETCLTYHSFDKHSQPRILDPLMSSSWLRLLRKSQPLSPQLGDRVWNYCKDLNACINQSTYPRLDMTSMTLPSHAKAIAFRVAMDSVKSTGFVRQAMINTICMLGLNTLDEVLSRLAELGEQPNINSVDSHDSFGVTPLGWVLFPRRHPGEVSVARPFTPPFESLDDSLQHAQRLISQFPVFDPTDPMWHAHAFAAIHDATDFTTRQHHLKYLYTSPFLFLLGNYLHTSQAKEVISQMENCTGVKLWSSLRSNASTTEDHVWTLLRPSSDLSTRDSKGVTLLHVCAQNGYTEFASIILGRHPELINATDRSGKTALHYAVSGMPRPSMVQLLLANDADVNIEDHAGSTPLHQTIRTGSFSLELLSEANISANNLERAWDVAFEVGARPVMSLLRIFGSNSSNLLSTGDDQTDPLLSGNKRAIELPLTAEDAKDFTEADLDFMMELSADRGASGEASPDGMDVANAAATIQNAIFEGAWGVQIDQATSTGATLLHLAIKHHFSEAIPLLLTYSRVPTNQLDISGRTPLHLAVFQQDSTLVRLLLECPRVIPDTPSRDGRTALAYAYQCQDEEIVSLLLNTGRFDPLHRDSYGKTAIEWAPIAKS
ncbi:hypothetical protein CEP52_007073 [Fusarium oligoseptatum]|uniref:Nephrocystin 3-like N-terminal domain-containing protein n=1 Tax=Fusarium oligoseptatum TaxID=2604345 RepID=A0A428TPX9_9HYPO|nr:hypothetical protein CEP52_007073 [Fusarium oligoseptatum]